MNEIDLNLFTDDSVHISTKKNTEIVDKFIINDTTHECIIPKNYAYSNISDNSKSIKNTNSDFAYLEFPYQLDVFQKISLEALHKNNSVFVCAHTSSGKTVIAEYAIAMALKDKKRIIYTSPIKALSNQKYRDLNLLFPNQIGLITGDISINSEAPCLVMTTEILKNLLYLDIPIDYVIFDEIHYMKEKERGTVWEESISLLNLTYGSVCIFLSATIPNSSELGDWIVSIHNRPLHIIKTEKRVVPLEYFGIPNGCNGMYIFNEDNMNRLIANSKSVNTENTIANSIEYIIKSENLPLIVFNFSRKECETRCNNVKDDFLTEEEKEMVELIYENSIKLLNKEDHQLPYLNIKPYLLRGVGIHHSGLLPIIKELIEILFQENLIKVLFATETFSIGLNMPAKAVLFTKLRKFDGVENRLITSGEFLQMSGRAGRRNCDRFGSVYFIVKDETHSELKSLFSGGDDITSQLKINCEFILNSIRETERILRRTFKYYKYNKHMEDSKYEENDLYWRGTKRQYLPTFSSDAVDFTEAFKLLKEEQSVETVNRLNRAYDCLTIIPNIKKQHMAEILLLYVGSPIFIEKGYIEQVSPTEVEVLFEIGEKTYRRSFPLLSVNRLYNKRKRTKDMFNAQYKELEGRQFNFSNKICFFCKNAYTIDCVDMICQPIPFYANLEKMIEDKNRAVLYDQLKKLNPISQLHKIIYVLYKNKYIENNQLLYKGRVAVELDGDLILAELFLNNIFKRPEETCAILSCFVAEEGGYISEEMHSLFIDKVEKYAKQYEEKLNYYNMDLLNNWARGMDFSVLVDNSKMFEGSVIRVIRRVDELLRKLVKVCSVVGVDSKVFSDAMIAIRRGIISSASLYF